MDDGGNYEDGYHGRCILGNIKQAKKKDTSDWLSLDTTEVESTFTYIEKGHID